jgi:GNAT superfamily N-acetyltransferase
MDIEIDSDKSRLQLEVIHRFLADSYWSKGIPMDIVRRAVEGSICFGAYDGPRQVGFARVVTDGATFAYLADVFVVDSHRGRGLASRLMEAVLSHPQLQGLRRWILATRDAHGLYARHGFTPLAAPERFMERHDPDIYLHPARK